MIDNSLCCERKRYVQFYSVSTILDVQKEAIRWVVEGSHPEMREKSNYVP